MFESLENKRRVNLVPSNKDCEAHTREHSATEEHVIIMKLWTLPKFASSNEMNMRQMKLMKKRTYPRFGNGFVTQTKELAGNKQNK
jgi:hypothetical protein